MEIMYDKVAIDRYDFPNSYYDSLEKLLSKFKNNNSLYNYKEFSNKIETILKKDNYVNINKLIELYLSYSKLLKLKTKDNRVLIKDIYKINIFLDNDMILQFNINNQDKKKFTREDISIRVLDKYLDLKDEITNTKKNPMLCENHYRSKLLNYKTSIESISDFIFLTDTLDEKK